MAACRTTQRLRSITQLMLNPNPYMALSTALGFSATDLNANRLGVLTSYQRNRLSSQRQQALSWPMIVLLLLLVVGYLLHVEFILIAFIGACLVTLIIATWQRFQEDLEGHVKVVAGQMAQHTFGTLCGCSGWTNLQLAQASHQHL